MLRKKKVKHKSILLLYLEFIPFILVYKTARFLPLKMTHAFFKTFLKTLYFLDNKHRTRSVQHLLHAGVAKNKEEAKKIAYASFMHGARLLTELAKMEKYFSLQNVSVAGSKETEKLLVKSGKENLQVIIVTAHYGNWEISGKLWTELSGKNLLTVIRSLDNRLIGKYIYKIRTTEKHKIIPKNNSVKYLLKALRHDTSVAILADQHASTAEGVETKFFGQPARTHSSVALLHLKTGVPIAPMALRCKDELFHYEAVLADLIRYEPTGNKEKDIAEVTQKFTTSLEEIITQQPEQWLWAPRRWLNINRKQRVAQ
jgi:KDO2-lipid IV(A) lauroyltransferase